MTLLRWYQDWRVARQKRLLSEGKTVSWTYPRMFPNLRYWRRYKSVAKWNPWVIAVFLIMDCIRFPWDVFRIATEQPEIREFDAAIRTAHPRHARGDKQ